MKLLLSKGLFTLIDDIDFLYLSNYRWYAKRSAYNWYAVRGIKVKGKVIHIRMHRYIMNAQQGQVVHHRNGNSLDNRRENLVVCTQRVNLSYRNKRKKDVNTDRTRYS